MTNNLKDELIKLQKETIKDSRTLMNHVHDINEWIMKTQKKYMQKETDVWHLQSKVSYLERILKKLKPDIELYEKDLGVLNEKKH